MKKGDQEQDQQGNPDDTYARHNGEEPSERAEAEDTAIRKPYRNLWLFLIAFGLLPLLGYGLARGAGALGGFLLGIVMIIL